MLSLDLIERNQEAGWYSHGVVFFTCMSSSLWLSSLWAIPPSRGFTVSTWLLCLFFLFTTVFVFLFFWCLCISSCLRICIFTVFVFLVAFNFILPPGCTSCWPPAAPTTLHWPPSLSEEALQLLGHFWTTQKKTVWTVLPCFQFRPLSNLD